MIRDKKIFFLGIFLFIVPFLGLPLWWKFALEIVAALVCLALAVDFSRFDINTFSPYMAAEEVQPKVTSMASTTPAFTQSSVVVEKEIAVEKTAEKAPEKVVEKIVPPQSLAPIPSKRAYRPRKKKIVAPIVSTFEPSVSEISSIDF